MKAAKLTLVAAALAAGTLVLTGCEPSNTAGSSGSSGGSGTTCDPNGWGPLSGCGSADIAGNKPAGDDTAPCEADPSAPDRNAGGVNDTRDGSERAVTDGDRCVTDSSLEFEREVRAWDQKINEAAQDGFTVTVTWIVVSIDVTGFRECVIGLREAPPNPDDHFSRRITTPEDCEAQQVDAVYRPVEK
ncbi:MAG: hypothetical protein ACRDSL_05095 [Pseudonocardiaceae bacterium]